MPQASQRFGGRNSSSLSRKHGRPIVSVRRERAIAIRSYTLTYTHSLSRSTADLCAALISRRRGADNSNNDLLIGTCPKLCFWVSLSPPDFWKSTRFWKSARFLKVIAFLKTGRFALGPKNVHQSWPLSAWGDGETCLRVADTSLHAPLRHGQTTRSP